MQERGPDPVVPGLLTESAGEPALAGSHCESCNTHYFPRRSTCANPGCRTPMMADVALSRRGTLYSYTVQAYRPPPLFLMEPWGPYAIGVVELPEGLRVMGMVAGVAAENLCIGMALELVVEPLGRSPAGATVSTYKFRPVPEHA